MRDKTIDIAKGIAITAIVLGHVLRGLVSSGQLDGNSEVFLNADRLLYMAHLAVFAFLSGLFVHAGIGKSGRDAYLRQRVTTFLYLYVVWSLFQGFAALVLSPEGRTIGTVLALWRPDSQMWFFLWLVVVTVAAAFVRPWAGPPTRVAVVLVGTLAISLVAWGILGEYAGVQGIGLVVFFFAGAALGGSRFTKVAAQSVWVSGAAVIVAGSVYVALTLWGATPPTTGGSSRTPLTVGLGVVASVCALVAVVFVAKLLSMTAAGRPVAFIGERSLEIFLAHVFAINAARVVLGRLGVDVVAIQVVAGTVAGVVLPVLLWLVVDRFRIPFVFAPPRVLLGRVSGNGSVPSREPSSRG